MSTIADIVTFAENRKPSLRKNICPATENDIAEFTRLAGYPLPTRFLELLRILGMRKGLLHLADADFDIQALIARYDVNEPQHDKRYILLAIDSGELYLDYYIDCIRGTSEDGPIVRFDYEATNSPVWTEYASLMEMVHVSVFRDFVIKERAYHDENFIATDRPAELLTIWRNTLSNLGFRAPLAESPSLCAVERSDAAVMARVPPEASRVSFVIGADTKVEMLRLQELLRDAASVDNKQRS